MNRHRHALLQLVAHGRISPAEAERLLVSWNRNHEDAWLVLACLLLAVLPQHAPLHPLLAAIHTAGSHLPVNFAALGQYVAKLHRITGGLQ